MNHPATEFEDRYQRELSKAVDKYGEIALLDTGHPDKDIFDYAINELVGLVRYAEMIENRAKLLTSAEGGKVNGVALQLISTAHHMRREARDIAVDLIYSRQQLKAAGLMLGEPEKR